MQVESESRRVMVEEESDSFRAQMSTDMSEYGTTDSYGDDVVLPHVSEVSRFDDDYCPRQRPFFSSTTHHLAPEF